MRDSRKDLSQVQKAKSGFKKATLVGVLALFFTFSFSSRALALIDISQFILGLNPTVVSDDVTTTGPTTDESKIFFLYNFSSEKFLNLGGYWGSHAVVSDTPYPFRLEKAEGEGNYYIVANKNVSDKASGAENGIGKGNYVGWATNNKTADKDPSISSYGVFASLPKTSDNEKQLVWHFTKNTTDFIDAKYSTYHISLNLDNVYVPTVTTTDGTASFDWGNPVSGTFYLTVTQDQNVYGDNNETDRTLCGAEALTKSFSEWDWTSDWILISLEEYNKLFNKTYKELTDVNDYEDKSLSDLLWDKKFKSLNINVSYLLHDPDFQINNPELNQWKYRNAEGANADIKDYISVGFDGYLKNATGDGFDDIYTNEYTDINGNSKTLTDAQISNRARRMGLQVKEDIGTATSGKVKGEIYQTIQITKPGLYTLSGKFDYDCETTKTPLLFVRYNNYTAVADKSGDSNATYKKLYNSQDWPDSYGFPMYNALAGNHACELNFFISSELLEMNNGSVPVEFGMKINPTESGVSKSKPYISTFANENSDVTSNSDATNYAWTVIDNFQLSFRGLSEQSTKKPDLILDEDEENLDYVEKASDTYANLRLHRTFSTDKWNSIILPVGLTQEQYNKAFESEDGANDGCTAVPLAELKHLTQSEIQFETVKTASAYGKDGVVDNTEYWLKPMTPYIIKANKANGGNKDEYTRTYNYWEEYCDWDNDISTFEKSINGAEKPYFLIENIKMVYGIIPTTAHAGEEEYLNLIAPMWNFKGLTAKTYTMDENGAVKKADCPYVVTTDSKTSNKGYIAALGTLARNYKETTTDGKTTKSLIAYRPSLKDSYTMSGGKLTYYSAGAAMKGFRCWFEYTNTSSTEGSSSAKQMPMLLLDGVNMTTGIDDIMANDEGISLISHYQKGIFSLGGQRICQDASSFDALPKGIYIVNGKKVIKD